MAKKKRLTNRQFTEENKLFRKLCLLAEVEPTKRQASKYRREQGAAFKGRNRLKALKEVKSS